MKSIRIETKGFSCIAEGAAHYLKDGFVTTTIMGDERYMRRAHETDAKSFYEVRLIHRDFLNVEASLVLLEGALT